MVILELDLTEVMKYPAGLNTDIITINKSHHSARIAVAFIKNYSVILTVIDSHPCSHVAQLTAEQREDMILQHELHLVFVDLPLKRQDKQLTIMQKHWLLLLARL